MAVLSIAFPMHFVTSRLEREVEAELERWLAPARNQLGSEAAQIMAEGRRMNLAEAVPYALESGTLWVAFRNPSNLAVVDEASQIAGRRVLPAASSEVRLALAQQPVVHDRCRRCQYLPGLDHFEPAGERVPPSVPRAARTVARFRDRICKVGRGGRCISALMCRRTGWMSAGGRAGRPSRSNHPLRGHPERPF